jgi:hypothetical protein
MSDLGGFSMYELFRAEVDTHCAALSDGLLKLESAPDDIGIIVPLMRAAHSIKGAARIVGIDAEFRRARSGPRVDASTNCLKEPICCNAFLNRRNPICRSGVRRTPARSIR